MSDHVTMTNPTHIADVGGVAIPVSDQARAVRFYVEKFGFEVRLDAPMGDGGRWVQVAPPGGRVPIALVVADEGGPSGAVGLVGVDTRITLTTADGPGDHAALAAAGVDTGELLAWPGVPMMFIVRDLDGNQLKVMEGAPR